MLIAVKFPREKGKKVNLSRFLRKFHRFRPSLLVEVPDEEAGRVLNVLTRNKCEVLVLKPAFRDVERDILEDMLSLIKRIRAGEEEPTALGKFAVEKIAAFSMKNLSEEVSDLLHLAIEFEENPSILILNQIEREAKKLLAIIQKA